MGKINAFVKSKEALADIPVGPQPGQTRRNSFVLGVSRAVLDANEDLLLDDAQITFGGSKRIVADPKEAAVKRQKLFDTIASANIHGSNDVKNSLDQGAQSASSAVRALMLPPATSVAQAQSPARGSSGLAADASPARPSSGDAGTAGTGGATATALQLQQTGGGHIEEVNNDGSFVVKVKQGCQCLKQRQLDIVFAAFKIVEEMENNEIAAPKSFTIGTQKNKIIDLAEKTKSQSPTAACHLDDIVTILFHMANFPDNHGLPIADQVKNRGSKKKKKESRSCNPDVMFGCIIKLESFSVRIGLYPCRSTWECGVAFAFNNRDFECLTCILGTEAKGNNGDKKLFSLQDLGARGIAMHELVDLQPSVALTRRDCNDIIIRCLIQVAGSSHGTSA